VDESGDLGFKKSSSKVFVIAAVVFEDERTSRLFVKHVRSKELPEIGTQEIKWNKSSPEFRTQFLERLADQDFDIGYAAILWKAKVSAALQSKRTRLYNYLTYHVVRWLANRRRGTSCEVILDRSIYGFREKNLNEYIESDGFKFVQREWEGELYLAPSKLNVHLSHRSSTEEPGLQVADMVAGAISHYWSTGGLDSRYFGIIERRSTSAFLFPRTR